MSSRNELTTPAEKPIEVLTKALLTHASALYRTMSSDGTVGGTSTPDMLLLLLAPVEDCCCDGCCVRARRPSLGAARAAGVVARLARALPRRPALGLLQADVITFTLGGAPARVINRWWGQRVRARADAALHRLCAHVSEAADRVARKRWV